MAEDEIRDSSQRLATPGPSREVQHQQDSSKTYDEYFIILGSNVEGESNKKRIKEALVKLNCNSDNSNVYQWPDDLLPTSVTKDQMKFMHKHVLDALHQSPQRIEKLINPSTEKLEKCKKVTNRVIENALKRAQEKRSEFFRYVEEIDDANPLLIVKINDVNDSTRKIRKQIGKLHCNIEKTESAACLRSYFDVEEEIGGDNEIVSEDEGELPKEYKNSIIDETSPEQAFYPPQIFLANKIVDRIQAILDRERKTLSSFEKFDFFIYTANIKMLEDQTCSRLMKREYECFPESYYEGFNNKASEQAKEKVFKYNNSSLEKHLQIKERVENEPKTLFLIVGDEAHWGSKTSGNLINTWSDDHPNVILLLVTATSYNIKTENTRLKSDYYKKEGDNYKIIKIENRTQQSDLNGFEPLHYIKWTDSFEMKLKDGIRVKLKIPFKESVDLNTELPEHSSQLSNEDNILPFSDIIVLSKEFLMIGTKSEVEISFQTETNDKMVLVIEEDKIGFIHESSITSEMSKSFSIIDGYGEGTILLMHRKEDNSEEFLAYNEEKRTVELGILNSVSIYGFEIPDIHFCFLLEECCPMKSLVPVKEYISLCYYFNSMRNKDMQDQLLRKDVNFEDNLQNIRKKIKPRKLDDDDILTAEYCYYIIIINIYRKFFLERNSFLFHEASIQYFAENFDDYTLRFPEKREEHINTFKDELDQARDEDIIPIKWESFEDYLHELQEKVKNDFGINLIEFQKTPTKATAINLLHSIVSCLIHMDKDEVRDYMQINIEDVLEKSQIPREMKFDNIFKTILKESETGCIIDKLIPDNIVKLNGPMIIIRANSMKAANSMYRSLCIARRTSSSINYSFEILRDNCEASLSDDFDDKLETNQIEKTSRFRIRERMQTKKCHYVDPKTHDSCDCENLDLFKPTFKCKECSHKHKRIECYEDLAGLSCILLLVQKGRLGDTFPKSFKVLDLRLTHRQGQITLASIVQELGRLCRYQIKSQDTLPYALLSSYLADKIDAALKVSTPYFSIVNEPLVKIDARVNTQTSSMRNFLNANAIQTRNRMVPTKDHFDKNNRTQHSYRLLLEAEPQIGKTGVFLKVISILRQYFAPDHETETAYELEIGLEDIERGDIEEDGNVNDNWSYPYWKDLENGSPLSKKISNGKYCRLFGPYQHGNTPQKLPRTIFMKSLSETKKRSSRVRQPNAVLDTFKSFSFRHHNSCEKCCLQCENIVVDIMLPIEGAEEQMHFKMSLPLLSQYQKVLQVIKPYTSSSLRFPLSHENKPISDLCLNSWIFIPTFSRHDTANLNLFHTMVSEKLGKRESCNYISVLAVRKSNFRAYCNIWQATHAILQIPDSLPRVEEDVINGGIGFARRSIQIFAESMGLDWIFMMDDNIPYFYEVQEKDSTVIRDKGSLKEKGVPLFKVLKHIEQQVDGSEKECPNKEYEKYSEKHSNENVDKSFEEYTGLSKKYGIIGIKKHQPYIYRVKHPFKKTHVHSLVLLNIKMLKEKNIYYEPYQVYEDLIINNDCDDKGLWVCKYNRFTARKIHMKTWIPDLYIWDDKVFLSEGIRDVHNSSDILMKYLHCECPIREIIQLPIHDEIADEKDETTLMDDPEIAKFIKQIKDDKGKYVMIVIPSNTLHRPLIEMLDYIQDQRYFVLLLETKQCIDNKLHSKMLIGLWLKEILKETFQYEVITSHKVGEFKIKIILVIVKVDSTSEKSPLRRLRSYFYGTKASVSGTSKKRHASATLASIRDSLELDSTSEKSPLRRLRSYSDGRKEPVPGTSNKRPADDTDASTSKSMKRNEIEGLTRETMQDRIKRNLPTITDEMMTKIYRMMTEK